MRGCVFGPRFGPEPKHPLWRAAFYMTFIMPCHNTHFGWLWFWSNPHSFWEYLYHCRLIVAFICKKITTMVFLWKFHVCHSGMFFLSAFHESQIILHLKNKPQPQILFLINQCCIYFMVLMAILDQICDCYPIRCFCNLVWNEKLTSESCESSVCSSHFHELSGVSHLVFSSCPFSSCPFPSETSLCGRAHGRSCSSAFPGLWIFLSRQHSLSPRVVKKDEN